MLEAEGGEDSMGIESQATVLHKNSLQRTSLERRRSVNTKTIQREDEEATKEAENKRESVMEEGIK